MTMQDSLVAVRKPLKEASTLPPYFYHSSEIYKLEEEKIFRRMWLFIGRSDEWGERGSFRSFNLFGVPFFVTRGTDDVLRAFSNSCSHRSSVLVEGKGSCNAIVCPYHSWSFALDGKLLAAPGMRSNDSFDRSQYGLASIKLEVWKTLVFVNFSSDPISLSEQLGPLGEYLESYDLENVVTKGGDEYVVETNWKAFYENSMEWLHHPTVHKQSILGKVKNVQRVPVDGGPGQFILIQSRADGVSRATLDNESGFPAISTLRGAAREGSQYVMLYPYTMLGCDVDSIWIKQMIPEGPERVRNVATYCFHKEAIAHPEYERIAPAYFRRFQKVVSEDNGAMEKQLKGLKSPFAKAGRYASEEILVHKFNNWVLDKLDIDQADLDKGGVQ